ncbi:hypothetical protein HI914_05363 [Erysiphe necator]|nr:hypothetical protein HI914_05363 [Erysiphe necator]
MSQTTEEAKAEMRARLQSHMTPLAIQRYRAQNLDPLLIWCRQHAAGKLSSERNRLAQQQSQISQSGQGLAMTSMQTPQSLQPNQIIGPATPLNPENVNSDYANFLGTVDSAAHKQQQGVIAQAEGQIVVPANSGSKIPSNQPMSMTGLPLNVNEQRTSTNTGVRAQPQQNFNPHQIQNQRLQHAQVPQQPQSNVRINTPSTPTTTKSQKIGLHGQPGGVGPGSVPQQSIPSSISTLNAPMKTPQMNQSGLPCNNSNSQLANSLDPRFLPGNQTQSIPPNVSNVAPKIFSEQTALQSEKLNEAINKWSSTPISGVRGPLTTVGTSLGTGQQMRQQAQLSGNFMSNQLAMASLGPRAPNVPATMTPQQALLQQQIANLRANPNNVTHRVFPPNMLVFDNQKLMQIDNAEIPPALLSHPNMPKGFPPEVTKWSDLKNWALTNTNTVGPQSLETIKNFQRLHLQNIMQRNRLIQQARQKVIANQASTNQITTPTPGITAPIAPMGPTQNSKPMMVNVNLDRLRQPTMADIQKLRNHHSGKMRNATDDQIRNFLLRSQQYHQQQQQMNSANNQIIGNQIPQSNNLTQSPSKVKELVHAQKNTGSIPKIPGKPMQASKTMQPILQVGYESVTQNSPRGLNSSTVLHQPPPNSTTQSQNSSPAQAVTKNLKRTSNGDLKEEMSSISSLQPTTPQTSLKSFNNASRTPTQKTGSLTSQQLALLTPEQRKKYENALQQSQMNRNSFKLDDQVKIVQEQISKEALTSKVKSMDNKIKDQVQKTLISLIQPTQGMCRALNKWFMKCGDVDRLKTFFRVRARLAMQFQDGKFEQDKIKNVFTISLSEIDFAKKTLNLMITDLRENFPCTKRLEQPKVQSVNPSQGPRLQSPANLQQQKAQLVQGTNSKGSQATSVPISNQTSFVIGTTSPHGTPSYPDKKKVNMELRIPARKKLKLANDPPTNSQNSTVTSISSPNVSNVILTSDLGSKSTELTQPSFFCSELGCDQTIGFEKESDLKQHMLDEHIRPNENPAKHAQDMFALALGLNNEGQNEDVECVSQNSISEITEVKMRPSNSQQENSQLHKASLINSDATPVLQQVSANQSNQSNEISLKDIAKATETKEVPTSKEIATKESVQIAHQETSKTQDSWASNYVHPIDLIQLVKPYENSVNGCMSDLNSFREATPDDTPESSKDGISEPNSDISDGVGLDLQVDLYPHSYMPFGLSDNNILSDEFLLHDENEINMKSYDKDQLPIVYQSFDDINLSTYEKRFSLDTHLFSFDCN